MIGIGVPTVVDAATIVHDSMAHLLDALEEAEQKEFLEEMISRIISSHKDWKRLLIFFIFFSYLSYIILSFIF